MASGTATKKAAKKAGGKKPPGEKKASAPKDAKPKEPKPAKAPKNSRKTVAETAPKSKKDDATKPKPLSETMDKPFALTTCKRLVALVEHHNASASRLAGLKESLKVIKNDLDVKDTEPSHERTLAVNKPHVEREIDEKKQSIKAGTTDILRLVIEAVGGTLFEVAHDAKPAGDDDDDTGDLFAGDGEPKPAKPGKKSETVVETPGTELAKPMLALPPGSSVPDDKGGSQPISIAGGPIEQGGAVMSWWAWLRANVVAWRDKDETKVGGIIRRFESSGVPTPSILLGKMAEWFHDAGDRKAAMESLPEATEWFWDGVREIFTDCAEKDEDGSAGVREAMVKVAKGNIDAWVEFAGGPGSRLNQLRVAHEK